MTEQERHDQQEFDEAVARKGKLLLRVLAGVGIVAALLMSMVALLQSGEREQGAASATRAAAPAVAKQASAASASNAAARVVDVKIIGGEKPGPDGKKHDAFSKTEYNVKVGDPVKLRIDNTDDVPHSISSPEAGVSIIAQPGVHTYTLLVNKAGKFLWYCMLPCDGDANGWAMQHPGYMSGYITAA
ncbi:MAG: cupredoxin domain-containing protein [Solirubrobacteraceae bacterium]